MPDRETSEFLARLFGGAAEAEQDAEQKTESGEPKSDEDAVEEQEFIQRLFAPKPGNVELIRRLHGIEEE